MRQPAQLTSLIDAAKHPSISLGGLFPSGSPDLAMTINSQPRQGRAQVQYRIAIELALPYNPRMKKSFLVLLFLTESVVLVLGNGGAWQEGVPGSGSVSASDKGKSTNVAIESEVLKIDLHAEYAAVEVHYRMHNTGPKVEQDFFFPVERWAPQDGEIPDQPADLEDYQISADGKKLAWNNVAAPDSKETAVSGQVWEENIPITKSWKKTVIPFEQDQTREIMIRYRARYSENNESVSDDSHISDAVFAYSLSPAATWKGPIGKGKIEINIRHPEPEDVRIAKPQNRFQKTSDTRFEWSFKDLKPALADDLLIVAHSKYDRYPTGYTEEDRERVGSYVLREHQYFLDHSDYEAKASSTLAPQGKHNYQVANIRGSSPGLAWSEGAEGDGIGESIVLQVKRPLPLYGILIRPGYWNYEDEKAWRKNNRVAALEITLNNERTFTETIPDEVFDQPYLIRVRDYAKPVDRVKLVIKDIHRGTEFRDTCISLLQLRAALAKKPEIQPAR
jgi:hypothetical protein